MAADEADVERMIAVAQHSGEQTLYLENLGLTEMPESIGRFTGLIELHLTGNRLERLPDSVAGLTDLRVLELGQNNLSEVPDWIGGLTELTDLGLADNILTGLPQSLTSLTNLTDINLTRNRLAEVPDCIRRFSGLTWLSLGDNPLCGLPDWIGELSRLECLDLAGLDLCEAPAWIGRLTRLECLYLDGNGLSGLPPDLGQLSRLELLYLHGNRLAGVPPLIKWLTGLRELTLDENQLVELPNWLAWLPRLRMLTVKGNPLEYPPPLVVGQGAAAVLAFLRAGASGSRRQWRSKLLIVGQGGAGKTSLLKALTTGKADPQEAPTHGLNIEDVILPHPTRADTTMYLAAWDFGGQHVYHATHQFFFTDECLFVLAWNARTGWDHDTARYWLDLIAARTGKAPDRPGAPVLLVATHCADGVPDLPLTELRRDYPQIVDSVQVDSLSEIGIGELSRLLATAAGKLPLMGSKWPASWLTAWQACCADSHSYMPKGQFDDLLTNAGVTRAPQRRDVTRALQRLGAILSYDDDAELTSVVVLKPQWLSERIAAILDSEAVAHRNGLLLAGDMSREWSDIDADLRSQLLTMMERFDVSYRIQDGDGDARAIVVDRLPWNPPDYLGDWDALAPPHARELRLHYVIDGKIPPGIPAWFIARAHQYATTGHRPWRTGVLLAHPDGAHLGLLQLNPGTNTVELAVRGPNPALFLGSLEPCFMATLKRYPGLAITRAVPCPCHSGCATRWPYDQLVERDRRGKTLVECGNSLEDVPITRLLAGIGPALDGIDTAIHLLRELRADVAVGNEQAHLRFAQVMSYLRVDCPTVFTIVERPRRIWGLSRYLVRLYCAEPDAVHQLPGSQGCYDVTDLDHWLASLSRHLTWVVGLLTRVTGLTGSVLGMTAPDLLERGAQDLARVRDLLSQLPQKPGRPALGLVPEDAARDHAATEADARRIEHFLLQIDPKREWGGLCKTTTPAGLTLYLCPEHAAAYKAPSPRPRGL
ncbi:MAG TPA: COR domain-containing protein [Actinocrinis sp.]|jgi:Leucine-rich repeat (LRR) protein